MIAPEDLDSPLRVDDCVGCGAIHWADCVCQPDDRRRRPPTGQELEQSRLARLVGTERSKS